MKTEDWSCIEAMSDELESLVLNTNKSDTGQLLNEDIFNY